MAKLNVNPTRMELTKLKLRLKTATRGHKLLKDKQDELMRKFIEMVKENKKLRENVEKDLSDSLKEFLLARSQMTSQELEESLMYPSEEIMVDITTKNIMSVDVPVMKFNKEDKITSIHPYGYKDTSSELDDAINSLNEVMPNLLKLAEVEKASKLLAYEIEKTRRRVNALEYMTIPQLNETIRFIVMKLDENERSAVTRIMKVKSMMEQKG